MHTFDLRFGPAITPEQRVGYEELYSMFTTAVPGQAEPEQGGGDPIRSAEGSGTTEIWSRISPAGKAVVWMLIAAPHSKCHCSIYKTIDIITFICGIAATSSWFS
jgi:hypothetical protein